MRPLLVLIQPVKFLNIMLEMSILDVPVKEPRRLGISSGHLFSRCPGLQSRESYHYFRCSGRWSDHQLRLQCRSFRSEGSTQNPFFVVSRIQFLSSALRSSPTIRRRGAALRSRSYSLETQALRSTSWCRQSCAYRRCRSGRERPWSPRSPPTSPQGTGPGSRWRCRFPHDRSPRVRVSKGLPTVESFGMYSRSE